jgi:DNA-binding CsgD family transcriptional regulator
MDALSASERRVASEAVRGATNADIAQRLFVTKKTVEAHLSSIYRKLGVTSRAELIAGSTADSDDRRACPLCGVRQSLVHR